MTEAEESERRQKEFAARTQRFIEALDVDETLAQLLASEGFDTVEEVAYVDLREIASIEGLDEQTAEELQNRARDYLERAAGRAGCQAQGAWGASMSSGEVRRPVTGDAGGARRGRHQVGRGSWPTAPPTI